ncbi:MAG: ParB N-terminal domain-containing protein [Clostridia bacterium]|nr:ParB N-terminal domain-containing protein [Clostridia bacterium]
MSIGKNSLARAAAAAGTKPAATVETAPAATTGYCEIALSAIRLVKGDKRASASEAFVASVAKQGVLEPLLLAQCDEQLLLLSGSRRLAAAKAAGLATVPAVIREMTAAEATAIRRELKQFAAVEEAVVSSATSVTAVGQDMPSWLL